MAAFDTVYDQILLTSLEHCLGITSKSLTWFKPYFMEHARGMSILGFKSTNAPLTHDVSQGSILGSIAFTTYILSLGDIAKNHQLGFHGYADNMQILQTE